MRLTRLALIAVFVLAVSLVLSRAGSACITVKFSPRQAFNSSKAVYLVDFSDKGTFDVVSILRGPNLKSIKATYIWNEAIENFSCTRQVIPEVGKRYILNSHCAPPETDSPITTIDCESEAYLLKDHEDYLRFLNEPCTVTRSEIIDLLSQWKDGSITTPGLSKTLTRLNNSCDVNDWHDKEFLTWKSISAEVLVILQNTFNGMEHCLGKVDNQEEQIINKIIVPLVELLQSDKTDPEEEEISTLLYNCQSAASDIHIPECYMDEEESRPD